MAISIICVLGFFTAFFFCWYLNARNKTRKVYISPSSGWLDINQFPVPIDSDTLLNEEEFLITDGKKVKSSSLVRYNKEGRLLFGFYDKTYVTHWQPLPSPPEKTIKQVK